jgi:hypothetical protein
MAQFVNSSTPDAGVKSVLLPVLEQLSLEINFRFNSSDVHISNFPPPLGDHSEIYDNIFIGGFEFYLSKSTRNVDGNSGFSRRGANVENTEGDRSAVETMFNPVSSIVYIPDGKCPRKAITIREECECPIPFQVLNLFPKVPEQELIAATNIHPAGNNLEHDFGPGSNSGLPFALTNASMITGLTNAYTFIGEDSGGVDNTTAVQALFDDIKQNGSLYALGGLNQPSGLYINCYASHSRDILVDLMNENGDSFDLPFAPGVFVDNTGDKVSIFGTAAAVCIVQTNTGIIAAIFVTYAFFDGQYEDCGPDTENSDLDDTRCLKTTRGFYPGSSFAPIYPNSPIIMIGRKTKTLAQTSGGSFYSPTSRILQTGAGMEDLRFIMLSDTQIIAPPAIPNIVGALSTIVLAFRLGNNWNDAGIYGAPISSITGIGFFNSNLSLSSLDKVDNQFKECIKTDPVEFCAYDPSKDTSLGILRNKVTNRFLFIAEPCIVEEPDTQSESESRSPSPSFSQSPEENLECCDPNAYVFAEPRKESSYFLPPPPNPGSIAAIDAFMSNNGQVTGCDPVLDSPLDILAGGVYLVRDHIVPDVGPSTPFDDRLIRLGMRIGHLWVTFNDKINATSRATVRFDYFPGLGYTKLRGNVLVRAHTGDKYVDTSPSVPIEEYVLELTISSGIIPVVGAGADLATFIVRALSVASSGSLTRADCVATPLTCPVLNFKTAALSPLVVLPDLMPLVQTFSSDITGAPHMILGVDFPFSFPGVHSGIIGIEIPECTYTDANDLNPGGFKRGGPAPLNETLVELACQPFFRPTDQGCAGQGVIMFDVQGLCNGCEPEPTPGVCPHHGVDHTSSQSNTRSMTPGNESGGDAKRGEFGYNSVEKGTGSEPEEKKSTKSIGFVLVWIAGGFIVMVAMYIAAKVIPRGRDEMPKLAFAVVDVPGRGKKLPNGTVKYNAHDSEYPVTDRGADEAEEEEDDEAFYGGAKDEKKNVGDGMEPATLSVVVV